MEEDKVSHSLNEKKAIDQLSQKIVDLKNSIKDISKNSRGLQIWLIIWTALMSVATIGLLIASILDKLFT